ncbi:MAG: glycosyltransferase family 2 protein [Methanosphaera stadtmanae]|nr:glycosyltransferase family 2 protein [Methanosphaera stadtmanae]
MQQPSVSIILPLKNDEKRVSDIIKNILNQKLPLFELLCIDGDSDDKTIEIAKSYAKIDNRVKIFLSYKKTMGGLINHGLTIAKGRYITVINKNETLKSNSLKYLYDLTQKNYIDIVQGNIVKNNSNTEFNSLPNEKAFKVINYPEFLDTSSIHGAIYKKSFLIHKKISFLEDDNSNYEKQFCIEAALKSDTIKYSKKRCYKYNSSKEDANKLNISAEGMLNLLKIRNTNSNDPNIKEKLWDILFDNLNLINENEFNSENNLSFETCKALQESLKYVDKEYIFNTLNDDDKYLYYKYKSPLILSISKRNEEEMKLSLN